MNALSIASSVDFRAIFHALVKRIENSYALKVNTGPVTGFYTGQFDGKEIWVDLDRDAQEAVFILVHLFGHTVQWNLGENLRLLGLGNSKVSEEDLPRICHIALERIGNSLSTFTALVRSFGLTVRNEFALPGLLPVYRRMLSQTQSRRSLARGFVSRLVGGVRHVTEVSPSGNVP